ncbi:MAG: CheY-like receiver [Phenylobacterium sp.]|nr:CheY-like receiver [Phenylobacterium sp.]
MVEDDHGICELISDMLGAERFEVACVASDREAYQRLGGAAAVDALIVDVNLGPGTTGFDVARFARQRNAGLPVIYVSGQASRDSFKAFGVPGSYFVAKPFTADELVDAVELAIGED